jgi:hypothetical protein
MYKMKKIVSSRLTYIKRIIYKRCKMKNGTEKMNRKTRIEKGVNSMLRIGLRSDDPIERSASLALKAAVDKAGAEFRRSIRKGSLVEA